MVRKRKQPNKIKKKKPTKHDFKILIKYTKISTIRIRNIFTQQKLKKKNLGVYHRIWNEVCYEHE